MSEARGLAPRPVPADVGIVAALAIEMADLVEGLKDVRRYQSASIPVIEGERGGKIVAVALSGPGRVAARAAADLLVSGHRPRLIIAAGFAGALDPSLARNDLVLPDEIFDREGFRHQVDKPPALGAGLGHAGGRLLTVDKVVLLASEKAELRAAYQADLVDMETSAVVQVCREKLVRFLAIRVISDDAHTDLPREVLSVLAHGGSYRVGAALRAVWQRPSSVKDFWKLYEHAIEAAGRLGKFLSVCLDELEI
jgi:adenosylhomocysteine nucleosidase